MSNKVRFVLAVVGVAVMVAPVLPAAYLTVRGRFTRLHEYAAEAVALTAFVFVLWVLVGTRP